MNPRLLILAMSAACAAPVVAEHLAITEVMYHPADNRPEFIEVVNLTSNRRDMAGWRLVGGGASLAFPAFDPGSPDAHMLREYERFILSSAEPDVTRAAYPTIGRNMRVLGPWTGSLSNSGDFIRLEDAAGALVCELTFGDNGRWPVAADGAGHSLVIVNENKAVDDPENWRASPRRGGSPGNAEPRAAEEPIPNPELTRVTTYVVADFNSTPATAGVAAPPNPGDTKWKFYNGQDAPPASWNQAGFDDSGWGPSDPSQGYAPLGFEPSATSATFPGIRTPVTPNQPLLTYYFRTAFDWQGPLTGNSVSFDHIIDDGAVVWLNGQVIGRERLTTDPALHTSPATSAASDGLYQINRMQGSATSLNGRLVRGLNTLAVEVHNLNATDSDMVMGLRMRLTNTLSGPVINEVKPGLAVGEGFVELYNPLSTAFDLNGCHLSDDPANLKKYTLSGLPALAAGGLATVDFATAGLAVNSPMELYLTAPDGMGRLSAVSVKMATDGRSAGRKPVGGDAWFIFATPTPGAPNQSTALATSTALRLNEAHFSIDGRIEWVEIANTGAGEAAAAGLRVASQRDFSDAFDLPATIPGQGFAVVNTNFAFDANGELIVYLIDAVSNVLEAVELGRREGLPSVQRDPGGSEWFNTPAATPGAANAPEKREEIVITEIMFAPPSSHTQGEFIEIHNRGASAVSLSGWRFVDGLNYDFPNGATLAPGHYAVVAKDPAYMTAHYPGIQNVFGPATGNLRNRGEPIRLEDSRGNVADTVHYGEGGQWPEGTRGAGSSLELIHPGMDNSLPSSWRASDESQKSTLQTYTHTDVYRELRGAPSAPTNYKELLLTAVNETHLLLKDITLTKQGSTANLITTGDATSHNGSSATGFLCTGTHSQSDTVPQRDPLPTGVARITGESGFHLISTGGGDTKNNKAEVDITGIARNDVLTLTFQARWISGTPLLVAQTWDRSFGKVFRLPIPNNLGTPGAVNSVSAALPAPMVDDMRHSPAVPTSTQPVLVTARVSSISPLASVELVSRLDNISANGAWAATAMNDAGQDGDAVAGDGLYTGRASARPDGSIVQFYIRATAANGQQMECPRQGAVRPGMWIVDNTPLSAAPGTLAQRFILSKYHRDALGPNGFTTKFNWDFPRMSSYEFNSTVIIGETTFAGGPEIFYNCGVRKGGSPWTRDSSNALSRLRVKYPGDSFFRNRRKSGTDNDAAGASRFHNRIVRYMLYLFGYPVPDHEFIQQVVNESAPLLGDDMEPTDSDFFNRAYVDGAEGELFEIDDSWFMYDGASEDRLDAGSVTGRWAVTDWNASVPAYPSAESPIFYHGNWPVRFPEDNYDYGSLSSFIRNVASGTTGAAGSIASPEWREQVERQLDVPRTAIYAAVRGYIGEWDNFTINRGKNGYFYKRVGDGKFEFHHWDSDLAFQSTGEAFLGTAGGVGWTNLTGRPWFRQQMNYYLTELLSKYTKGSPRMLAWLEAMNYQSGNSNTLAPFKTNVFNYENWFNGREAAARSFVNAQGGANFTRAFAITTAGGQTVAAPLFAIEGSASSHVWAVQVEGHPEALFEWIPETSNMGRWRLSGIALASGVNTLTVNAVDRAGGVAASLPFVVTLSLNAPPMASLKADPADWHLPAGALLALDATGSFDPEGGALNFTWDIEPAQGAAFAATQPGRAEARFSVPGIYTVTLRASDAAGNLSEVKREATVYAGDDLRLFSEGISVGNGLSAYNVAPRDNWAPSSWYSLEDFSGRLEIQVLDDSAKPLGNPNFTHPLITRALPATGDFVLQTKLEEATRQFGSFVSGLWVEFFNRSQPVRYAYGVVGGTQVGLFRATGAGAWELAGTTQPFTAVARSGVNSRFTVADGNAYVIGQSVLVQDASDPVYNGLRRVVNRTATAVDLDIPFSATATGALVDAGHDYTGNSGVFRVRRKGQQLFFEWQQPNGAWRQTHSATLAGGVAAERGGFFVATTNPTTVRVAFHYLLVADPARVNPLLGSLRLTELMYHPAAGGVEFIELQNVGAQAINLAGANFADGSPFAAYAFGGESLAPGEYIVLVSDVAGFRAKYGPSARLAPAWSSGSLNNAGEAVILRDPQGSPIHDFVYGSSAPWPAQADGLGPSLEVIDVHGNYNDPANWRASVEPGGSPGSGSSGLDSDGDGTPDGVEALFGTDPNDAASFVSLTATFQVGGPATLQWPTVAGRSYRVEHTTDFRTWTAVETIVAAANVSSFTPPAAPDQPHLYYRVMALP